MSGSTIVTCRCTAFVQPCRRAILASHNRCEVCVHGCELGDITEDGRNLIGHLPTAAAIAASRAQAHHANPLGVEMVTHEAMMANLRAIAGEFTAATNIAVSVSGDGAWPPVVHLVMTPNEFIRVAEPHFTPAEDHRDAGAAAHLKRMGERVGNDYHMYLADSPSSEELVHQIAALEGLLRFIRSLRA